MALSYQLGHRKPLKLFQATTITDQAFLGYMGARYDIAVTQNISCFPSFTRQASERSDWTVSELRAIKHRSSGALEFGSRVSQGTLMMETQTSPQTHVPCPRPAV
jgi:hypothetical protein